MDAIFAHCLSLGGPTGSGKTALALQLAARFPIEIISVDSALIYQGMDIGTAKPTRQERSQVPHHLIDIIEPEQTYSAARFASDARQLIADILARGRTPLLVGGTMLYFKALFDGLDAMPSANPQVRAQLARTDLATLYAQLQQVDPLTAARLAPADKQRIQRALEVYLSTGQPLSSFHHTPQAQGTPTFISLEPQDRSWLHQRLAQRFTQMLQGGLIDEVKSLQQRPQLHADLPAMRCVGYRQAWQCLAQNDLASLPEKGQAATRQLAKRQLTWLRRLSSRHVVACDQPHVHEQVTALVQRWHDEHH